VRRRWYDQCGIRLFPRRSTTDAQGTQFRTAQAAVEIFTRAIQQADQKAGFLGASLGVLLAGTAAAQRQLAYSLHVHAPLGLTSLAALAGFVVALVITGVLVGRVLLPRFTSGAPNLLFFGRARQLPREQYAMRLLGLDSAARELAFEAWDLALIAHVKHSAIRRAIYSFGIALLLFATWLGLASAGLPAPP
jgi:hypothetical protein